MNKDKTDQMLEMEIADQVFTVRCLENWSQAELARRVGTSQPAIARLESGRSAPSFELLKRIATAVGLRLHISFVSRQYKEIPTIPFRF